MARVFSSCVRMVVLMVATLLLTIIMLWFIGRADRLVVRCSLVTKLMVLCRFGVLTFSVPMLVSFTFRNIVLQLVCRVLSAIRRFRCRLSCSLTLLTFSSYLILVVVKLLMVPQSVTLHLPSLLGPGCVLNMMMLRFPVVSWRV